MYGGRQCRISFNRKIVDWMGAQKRGVNRIRMKHFRVQSILYMYKKIKMDRLSLPNAANVFFFFSFFCLSFTFYSTQFKYSNHALKMTILVHQYFGLQNFEKKNTKNNPLSFTSVSLIFIFCRYCLHDRWCIFDVSNRAKWYEYQRLRNGKCIR